jgi:hypothetical protein
MGFPMVALRKESYASITWISFLGLSRSARNSQPSSSPWMAGWLPVADEARQNGRQRQAGRGNYSNSEWGSNQSATLK